MEKNNRRKLLLFDLDNTLLRSDKTISKRTIDALRKCRKQGILIGISTSRAVHNCMTFLPELTPDLFIASGGAVIKYRGEYIYTAEFTIEETQSMIRTAREVCGSDCEITIDTLNAHYWNYKVDPKETDATWGDTIFTDFFNYSEKALKFCVEIFDDSVAKRLADCLLDCDCIRFAGTAWYKFTKKEATKENAILKACDICGIALEDVTAFGDDAPDIGMLKLCGIGVAMGNALDSVKKAADIVIGSNDDDGIAKYLEQYLETFDAENRKGGDRFMTDEFMLIRPTSQYASQLAEYRREFLAADSSMDGCGPLRRFEDPEEYIQLCRDYEDPEKVPAHLVPATQLLFIRKSDDRLVGMIQVRHQFNDYLEKYAGHIGYSVRPSERRKGYAKEMLKLALPFCREIGISQVLIACIDGNIGSEKTILANGGVYESTVHEPNRNINLKRFWIKL